MIFMEIINSIGLTVKEQTVVKMTMQNYTETEIGNKLGVTHQRVGQYKDIIGEKMKRRKDDLLG